MKRIQENAVLKLAAWVIFAGAVLLGLSCALNAVVTIPYLGTDSYEQTKDFSALLTAWEVRVADGFALEAEYEEGAVGYYAAQQSAAQLEEELLAENTNFRFVVLNEQGEDVTTNLPDGESLGVSTYCAYFAQGNHWVTTEYENVAQFSSEINGEENIVPLDKPIFTILCSVCDPAAETAVADDFQRLYDRYLAQTEEFPAFVLAAVAALLTAVLAFACILWTAGHRPGVEGIFLGWQDRLFFEGYVLITAALIVLGFAAWWDLSYEISGLLRGETERWFLWAQAGVVTLLALWGALCCRTLAVRLKGRAFFSTSLLCRGAGWLWSQGGRFVRSLPLTWKTALGFLVYLALSGWMFYLGNCADDIWYFFWCVGNGAVLLALCWWTECFQRLRKGSGAIAAGDLNHQIDVRRMPRDLKRHGEELNNITQGLQNAVNERIKSERFKAELITNVSHDLKTPLTSIISYVDLLKTTQQTDPKAQEYIAVLDRKSQRLKKLTEDLVEASKASTGVLAVSREKLSAGQLIDQALGEWSERLEAKGLQTVVTLPEGETWLYADGRHLWRILDNLLGNCAKYALEGTRVYLDLARGHGQVVLSVKNISREALNIPPERLMERFVRGEESRTGEGSGLGLSIARSLTELQGGTFDLAVDGDLFKAVVTLPQAN